MKRYLRNLKFRLKIMVLDLQIWWGDKVVETNNIILARKIGHLRKLIMKGKI